MVVGDREPSTPAVLISIVMPVWRPHPVWFEAALRSVLADERYDIEIIVVDDGNDIPVDLPVDDPRIELVIAEHGGPYAARNVGLRVARGTHIRYVDADDVVVAGSSSRLVDLLDGRDDLIAYGETDMCNEALEPYRRVSEHAEGDVADLCLSGGFDVFHVSMMIPHAVVRSVGSWDTEFRVSGDWDYVMRAVEAVPVVRLDEVVTLYRRNPGSVMSSARIEDGLAARRRVIERCAHRRTGQVDRATLRTARGHMFVDAARAWAWRGQRWLAIRAMAAGLIRTPIYALRSSAGLVRARFRQAISTR